MTWQSASDARACVADPGLADRARQASTQPRSSHRSPMRDCASPRRCRRSRPGTSGAPRRSSSRGWSKTEIVGGPEGPRLPHSSGAAGGPGAPQRSRVPVRHGA